MVKPKRQKPAGSGRKKGSVNRRTSELETKLQALNLDPVKGLATILPTLDSKDQMSIYLGLMPYLYPKRASIQMTTEDEERYNQMKALEKVHPDHLKHLLQNAIEEGKTEIDLDEL